MSKPIGVMTTLALASLLAACGGNSGSGTSDAGPSTVAGVVTGSSAAAEGTWTGSNSLGNAFDMLLLESGDLYQVFGSVSAGVFTPLGLDQGSYTMSGTTLTSPVTQFNYNGSTATGTLTAAVVEGSSIKGSASSKTSTTKVDFSATPLSATSTTFNYNTPAAISDIAGPWTGHLVGQSAAVLFSIDNAGVLAATNLGCSLSGTVAPRASGKNVFNVSLTFGQGQCPAAGKTVTGVAMSYIASNGLRQFTAMALDKDKTVGTVLYAQR